MEVTSYFLSHLSHLNRFSFFPTHSLLSKVIFLDGAADPREGEEKKMCIY